MANKDFEELFECLRGRNVKALVVGAHAVAYHAKPRYTKDVDVLVEPSVANRRASAPGARRFRLRQPGPQDLADLDWLKQVEKDRSSEA